MKKFNFETHHEDQSKYINLVTSNKPFMGDNPYFILGFFRLLSVFDVCYFVLQLLRFVRRVCVICFSHSS